MTVDLCGSAAEWRYGSDGAVGVWQWGSGVEVVKVKKWVVWQWSCGSVCAAVCVGVRQCGCVAVEQWVVWQWVCGAVEV